MPTLAEYKKQTTDPLRAGVIQTYHENSPALSLLNFQNINGGTIKFNREKTLPGNVGFRALDANYTASFGEIETISEDLKIEF